MKKRKTFDAVVFMRKRREEFSRVYAGLSAEQIKKRIRQTLKDNPLWKQRPNEQAPLRSRKKTRSEGHTYTFHFRSTVTAGTEWARSSFRRPFGLMIEKTEAWAAKVSSLKCEVGVQPWAGYLYC